MRRTIFIKSFGVAIILGLSLPLVSSAAFHETQSPSGSKLPSPVTFSVTADNFSDLNFGPGVNSWKLRIFAVAPPPVNSQTSCLTSSTLSATVTSPAISESFPAQDYELVLVGYHNSDCTSYATSSVVGGPVNITGASGSLADSWPLLLVVVIILGFAIIRKKNAPNPAEQQ